jgi:haloacid dehalogenase-like hydrolase
VLFDRDAEGQVVAETMDWDHPHRRGYWEGRRHFICHAAPLEDSLTEDPIQVMFNGDVATMREIFAMLEGVAPVAARAAALGLEPGQVMAIGDNLNDLEMLTYASVPVIMGNAVDDLKGHGWLETATNNEAGVAQAIRRFVL